MAVYKTESFRPVLKAEVRFVNLSLMHRRVQRGTKTTYAGGNLCRGQSRVYCFESSVWLQIQTSQAARQEADQLQAQLTEITSNLKSIAEQLDSERHTGDDCV